MQYEHEIFCVTEDAYIALTTNDRVRLEVCPNNGAHEVSRGSERLIREIPPIDININKEPGFETNGYVSAENVTLSAGAGATVSVTRVWPMNIAMYGFIVPVATDCVGCKLTAEAAPLTAAGTLAADAPAGSTVLTVSPSVVAAAKPWFVLSIDDGSVTELGRIASVNVGANTVTLVTATPAPYTAGATLLLTVRSADQIELATTGILEFGKDRSKAVSFVAGRSFKLTLVNPNAAPAKLTVYITFNY
jgi:hypothetical protein